MTATADTLSPNHGHHHPKSLTNHTGWAEITGTEETAKSGGSSSGGSSSSRISSKPSTATPRRGVGGGATRGRGERALSSPPSRAPPHDIWSREDSTGTQGDGNGGGDDGHGDEGEASFFLCAWLLALAFALVCAFHWGQFICFIFI